MSDTSLCIILNDGSLHKPCKLIKSTADSGEVLRSIVFMDEHGNRVMVVMSDGQFEGLRDDVHFAGMKEGGVGL